MLAALTVIGVTEVWLGTMDPVQGETVQPAMETHSHSSATDARDGATWPKSTLHQHLL